ncbi:MAG TPA: hypothetical protein VHY84_15005 [Bryobacteraceae bacterium]|jgi:hypothetical protein|nr:hypothetical protein [Bryobacteraceae bacterium]
MLALAIVVFFAAVLAWRVVAKTALRAAVLAIDLAIAPLRLMLWALRLRCPSLRKTA